MPIPLITKRPDHLHDRGACADSLEAIASDQPHGKLREEQQQEQNAQLNRDERHQ